MKQIKYIAISKNKSLRFGTHSYLIEIEKSASGRLLVGKELSYGFLAGPIRVGAKRGWFINDVSIGINDFDKYYTKETGTKKYK